MTRTTPQYTVLAALEREGELSASDLGRELAMTAQTLNVLVQALEAARLVRRNRHPSHGRILRASLTESGRQALKHGREVALSVEDRVLRRLTPPDRARLVSLLKTVEESPVEGAVSA